MGDVGLEEREQLRGDAVAVGAKTELIVLDLPLDVLWQRVVQRGREDPPITREQFDAYDRSFQRPDAAESARYDAFTWLSE